MHALGRYRLPWREISHVAVTHFHTDHVGDLPALFWAYRVGMGGGSRQRPLIVLGPPGIRRFMERLAGAFGGFMLELGFPVEVVELARRDRWEDESAGLRVATHPTVHTDQSVAYRVESGTAVGYTGDTGPDPDLFRFFAGADLVISECAEPDPPSVETHLSPAGVAELGRIAQPGRIVTTHVYAPMDPERVPDLVRQAGWQGQILAGYDGLAVELGVTGSP